MPAHDPSRYWDTSGVVVVLFDDPRSAVPRRLVRGSGRNLLSSLAYVEATAVIVRKPIPRDAMADAYRSLRSLWRSTSAAPRREAVAELAERYPLRGADLWHLATAIALREEAPTLRMVTYDNALAAAASAEGFLVDQ